MLSEESCSVSGSEVKKRRRDTFNSNQSTCQDEWYAAESQNGQYFLQTKARDRIRLCLPI